MWHALSNLVKRKGGQHECNTPSSLLISTAVVMGFSSTLFVQVLFAVGLLHVEVQQLIAFVDTCNTQMILN